MPTSELYKLLSALLLSFGLVLLVGGAFMVYFAQGEAMAMGGAFAVVIGLVMIGMGSTLRKIARQEAMADKVEDPYDLEYEEFLQVMLDDSEGRDRESEPGLGGPAGIDTTPDGGSRLPPVSGDHCPTCLAALKGRKVCRTCGQKILREGR